MFVYQTIVHPSILHFIPGHDVKSRNNVSAASTQYEYGLRLGRESHGLKGLQKQAKCYLAAMNALHLVQPDYAWIVVPTSLDQSKVGSIGYQMSLFFAKSHLSIRIIRISVSWKYRDSDPSVRQINE